MRSGGHGYAVVHCITASGTCTHASKQPIHLILGLPHMHVKGTHMRVDLTRASGKQEVVHDKPFDFNYQVSYLESVVLQPGETHSGSWGIRALG